MVVGYGFARGTTRSRTSDMPADAARRLKKQTSLPTTLDFDNQGSPNFR
jgi:hypothetical protein